MAERYETSSSEQRRRSPSADQRTQRIDRVRTGKDRRPLTEEEERARRRRIAERKRRKKREKRINTICAIIAVVAFSFAICTGVLFFKAKSNYTTLTEQKTAAEQEAREKGLEYEKMKAEIEELEKEIAGLKTQLPTE